MIEHRDLSHCSTSNTHIHMATVIPRKDFTAAKCVKERKVSLVNRAAYTHRDSESGKVQGS